MPEATHRKFRENEWAWITGATSGIGRAVAQRLASEGLGVVISGRRQDELATLATEIKTAGGNALAMPLDVTNFETLSQAAREIGERTGRLDVVIPAAGNDLLLPFEAMSPKKWQKLLDVHVIGAFEMVRVAMPLLRASGQRTDGQGRVIFVSSISAIDGYSGILAYSASKAAVLGGMRSLAIELSPLKIRVNAVTPGYVKTPMQAKMFSRIPEERRMELEASHPLGLGTPQGVAAAISYLASYESMWVTGLNMILDGGATAASASFRR